MLKLTELSISELADLLRKTGSKYADEDRIRDDIADGAPTNSSGSINLVNYAAWLVKGMGRGSD